VYTIIIIVYFEGAVGRNPAPILPTRLDGPNPSTFCTFCGEKSERCWLVKLHDSRCGCTHLSNGHGAQDIEEDEGAVSEVAAHQVAVGNSSQESERFKWKFCNHTTIKPGGNQVCSVLG